MRLRWQNGITWIYTENEFHNWRKNGNLPFADGKKTRTHQSGLKFNTNEYFTAGCSGIGNMWLEPGHYKYGLVQSEFDDYVAWHRNSDLDDIPQSVLLEQQQWNNPQNLRFSPKMLPIIRSDSTIGNTYVSKKIGRNYR
jgi:hypothetical protein